MQLKMTLKNLHLYGSTPARATFPFNASFSGRLKPTGRTVMCSSCLIQLSHTCEISISLQSSLFHGSAAAGDYAGWMCRRGRDSSHSLPIGRFCIKVRFKSRRDSTKKQTNTSVETMRPWIHLHPAEAGSSDGWWVGWRSAGLQICRSKDGLRSTSTCLNSEFPIMLCKV